LAKVFQVVKKIRHYFLATFGTSAKNVKLPQNPWPKCKHSRRLFFSWTQASKGFFSREGSVVDFPGVDKNIFRGKKWQNFILPTPKLRKQPLKFDGKISNFKIQGGQAGTDLGIAGP